MELGDARDVEIVAALLQNGQVPAIGAAQAENVKLIKLDACFLMLNKWKAHEAHLPFLLHFLSESGFSAVAGARPSLLFWA